MARIELSTPSDSPVEWVCRHKPTRSSCLVEARSWYGARKEGAKMLGVEPESLDVRALDEKQTH